MAFLLPAFVIMTAAAAALFALPDAAWVRGALTGLQVAVVGILAAASWRLVRSEAPSAVLSAVVLGAFVAGLFVNAAVVVAAAGVIGIGMDRVKANA
jgi:chromate transport protein ChrA